MSIGQQLVNIAENVNLVYQAGKKSIENKYLPLYYISCKDFQWYKVEFPENFNFVFKCAKTPYTCNAMLSNATNVKSVKLECDEKSGLAVMSQAFREIDSLETIDLRNFNLKVSNLSYFIYSSKNIKTILGALDLTQCTTAANAFTNAISLENIEFAPKSIKMDLDFHWSTKLTHGSLLSILNGLYNCNIDIDISKFLPDYAGDLVPGIYKITDVEVKSLTNGSMYVSATTDAGFKFRVYNIDCGSNWNTVLDGMLIGNYIDFSGSYKNSDFVFDYLRIRANPNSDTYTLNLGDTNLAKLSEEEKLIATNKGWTLI